MIPTMLLTPDRPTSRRLQDGIDRVKAKLLKRFEIRAGVWIVEIFMTDRGNVRACVRAVSDNRGTDEST